MMEEQIIISTRRVSIFSTKTDNRKMFVGFQGLNSLVIISLGGIELKCFDHKISCYLAHALYHDVDLIVEPIDNLKEWGVKTYWDNDRSKAPVHHIMDETKDEIIVTIRQIMGMFGVNYELHQGHNTMKKIIKELSNKHFLEDEKQEQKVIEILQEYYDNMKY